ncbi:4-hydroxy-3-methylbut-2-en-1-yl diphosphate synthase, partial [Actinomadura sp. DSM 109109]|nr:4-hydroxy-3-methylbut-2-en-1-yl diphosphate synthase [Actinomadura lepetitiana]
METTTRDFRSDTSMTVNLGMPTPPIPTLAPRRKTHQIKVG